MAPAQALALQLTPTALKMKMSRQSQKKLWDALLLAFHCWIPPTHAAQAFHLMNGVAKSLKLMWVLIFLESYYHASPYMAA